MGSTLPLSYMLDKSLGPPVLLPPTLLASFRVPEYTNPELKHQLKWILAL